MRNIVRLVAMGFVLALFNANALRAQVNATWVGIDGSWNDATQWSTNPTAPNGPSDTAAFLYPSNPSTITISSAIQIGSIWISDFGPGYNFNITGTGSLALYGGITVDATVPVFTVDSGGSMTFNGSADSGTARFIVHSGGSMDFSNVASTGVGSIEGAGAFHLGSAALTVGNNNLDATVSGVIDGSGGSLTKNGSGTLILSGANTYSGGTTINSGVLQFANQAALPATGLLTVWYGGTAAFNVGGAGEFTQAGIGQIIATQNFQSGANFGIDTSHATGNVVYSDVIADTASGQLGLMKLGNGTLELTAANTYTGATIVNGGTLLLSGSGFFGSDGTNYGTLSVSGATVNLGGNSLTLGGVFSAEGTITNGTITNLGWYGDYNFLNDTNITIDAALAGAAGLQKSGTGTLTLAGANTYAGNTTVSAGTLALTGAGTLGSGLGGVDVSAGATLDLTGISGSLTADYINGGGTYHLGSVALTAGNAYGYTVSGNIDGSGASLTKVGTGSLTLSGTNTYTGGSTVSEGILLFDQKTALPASGALSVASGATASFGVGGSGRFTATDINALLAGTSFAAGSNLGLDVAHGNYTYSSVIADANGGANPIGLSVTGGYVLTLTGANTYSGGTTIANGGQLSVSADNQLGAASGGLTLGTGGLYTTSSFASSRGITLTGGQFDFVPTNGTTLTLNGVITGTGGLMKDTNNSTLVLDGANDYSGGTTIGGGTLTFSGSGSLGSGTLSVFGSGSTLDLGGTSQFADAVIVLGGVLQGSGTLSANDFIVSGYGTLNANLSGSGGLTVNNSDLVLPVHLNGMNTFSGDTSITRGRLILGNTFALSGSTLDYNVDGGSIEFNSPLTSAHFGGLSGNKDLALLNNAGTPAPVSLTVGDHNNDTTYSGNLSGAGASLVKSGTGTLTLLGTNTYDGGTSVASGTLQFGQVSALAPGALNVAAGATATFNVGGSGEFTPTEIDPLIAGGSFQAGSFIGFDPSHGPINNDDIVPIVLPVDYSGNLSGSFGVVMVGNRTLNLTGNLSYTGDTIIHSGTLAFQTPVDSTLHSTNIRVGTDAGDYGDLGIFNSGVVRATNVTLGEIAGSTGRVDINVGGALYATNLTIGAGGNGYFAVSNSPGGVTTSNVVIGRDAGSVSRADVLGGGTWTNSGTVTVGDAGTGTLRVAYYGAHLTSPSVLLGAQAGGSGTLVLDTTGTLTTGQVTRGAGAGAISFVGGTLQAAGNQTNFLSGFSAGDVQLGAGGGRIDTNGYNVGISATLQGTGQLTKSGGGTLSLSALNTYTGGTTIDGGTLRLDGNNALGTGGLNLAGGTLDLNHFSQSALTGTLTLSSSSFIDFNVLGSALIFAGSSANTWNGILTITNFDNGTDAFRVGTNSSGLTSTQLGLIDINGFTALIDGAGYITASATAYGAVPEPSTYAALAGVAALGLAALRRRRHAEAAA